MTIFIDRLRRRLGRLPVSTQEQLDRVVELADRIRERLPDLSFAVAGVGEPGGLPDWILDLRVARPDEADERVLCQRYADSHVVIGVHGSNMLLPSAHAGAVLELLPQAKLGNLLDDILVRREDQRETLFDYRVLPMSTPIKALAEVVVSMLLTRSRMSLNMGHDWCRHGVNFDCWAWSDRRLVLQKKGTQRENARSARDS